MISLSSVFKRLRKERFSLRFILSTVLLRLGISLPISITFDRSTNTRIWLTNSSIAHNVFRGRLNPTLNKTVYRHFVHPGATVIDIGANIGIYTLLSAHIAGKQGRVIALEPTKSSFRDLLSNIELNNLSHTILPQLSAVSDTDGITHLIDLPYSKEQNRLASKNDQGNLLPVQSIRLDTLLDQLSIQNIDFLKIDIEGSEYEAILSLGERIHDVSIIYFECRVDTYQAYGHTSEEIISYLTDHDFKVVQPYLTQQKELKWKKISKKDNTGSSDILALRNSVFL